ncbi:DUF2982 domain-containing protein [Paraglaciecola psychrophila]|uniref:DUF2982 domain-containing protein n=1 Tax=Paraglaciecola psychrophila 170 TaxID=1129794 RepID=K6ZSJ2_9ALTE|nr:DUF2982 domain-containing protein [Paraglaciecola psychrophila]AGH42631.1 hypothetical protein C427_0521 [Paraglaciecola psychrophila 170]GAC38881.1 hypothetical protein GPSY_3270 [Paraglaciecola psychrophila 170]
MQDIIEIRSQVKRNVIVSVLIGLVGLSLASITFSVLPKSLYLIGIFLTSASLVALLIAWVKYREPQFSFLLSKTFIIYKHRHGQWQLDWSNIQRVDVPKVTHGLELKSLEMVAIKIKSYSAFLEKVSPRLMTNILMEQRPLLFQTMPSTENCATGNCHSDDMLEHDYFKDSNGAEYRGIQAMFANRMTKLRARLGYDIFVAGSELDRSEQEFVELLRQCQQRVLVSTSDDEVI